MNKIGEIIENESPIFSTETNRAYHIMTYGFILNELIRRVDP